MTSRTRAYERKMRLDMSLAEALARLTHTDPREVHANIAHGRSERPSRRDIAIAYDPAQRRRSLSERP